MSSEHQCPSCNSDIVRRVHRSNNWQRFLGVWGFFPYSCRQCRKRYYANDYDLGFFVLILSGWLLSATLLGGGVAWLLASQESSQYNLIPGPAAPARQKNVAAGTPVAPSQAEKAVLTRKQRLEEDIVRLKVVVAVQIKEDAKKERLLKEQKRLLARAEERTQLLLASIKNSTVQPERRLLAEVFFGPGRVEPGTKGAQTLERVAGVIRKHPGAVVLVGGYADNTALNPRNVRKYGDNTGLSLSRAMSVYRLLKQMGVDQSRMVVLAHGIDAAARASGASSKSTGKRRVSVALELPASE